MTQITDTQLDKIFHCMADHTRRQILDQILSSPLTVNEIAEQHNMSLNAVSKHIKVMESADLIHKRRQGRHIYCEVNLSPLDEMQKVIEYYKRFWTERFDALEHYINNKKN